MQVVSNPLNNFF